MLIQKIFGFGLYPPGWQIERTNIAASRRDCNAVLAFLHPSGPLFSNLIYKLLCEEVAFEFPYEYIPVSVHIYNEYIPVSTSYEYIPVSVHIYNECIPVSVHECI